jgi:hypothetical protein
VPPHAPDATLNYEDIARDFVERTRMNLQAARQLPASGDIRFYEVTHLVNSLLGLIVVPDQRMQDRLPTRRNRSYRIQHAGRQTS